MDESGKRRILMPGVFDEAERAEPPGRPEPGLVPVRDPGDVGDPGPADRQAPEGDEIGGAAQAAPPGVAHSSAVMTVAQSGALVWMLRSAGFRWRPRLDLRGSGLGEAARTATWMLLYIVVAQLGVLVTANVATRAGDRATAAAGHPEAGTAFALLAFVPARQVVVGLPAAYGLFYLVGATGAALVLRRRLGGMDGRRILRALTRLHPAALPALAFAAAVVRASGRLPGDRAPALLALAVGGLGGGALYLLAARRMNVPEIGYFSAMAAARFRRRQA
ncbi:hypothetical protein SM611_06910 [Actinomadura sp. DLS-62]|uniref:Yip1 domain-containing protein n=1 Tax=Actinomadura monticuli TaxID=3097367 RepID=A0ABV4Q680_9ACTN